MHPLTLLAATAACAFARPPGATMPTVPLPALGPLQEHARPQTLREALNDYMVPQYFVPPYLRLDERSTLRHQVPAPHDYVWLTREIDRLNLMELEDEFDGYDPSDRRADLALASLYDPRTALVVPEAYTGPRQKVILAQKRLADRRQEADQEESYEDNNVFAFTPLQKGFFVPEENISKQTASFQPIPPIPTHRRDGTPSEDIEPRQLRQNPNRSKTKTLIAENLDKLRNGVSHEEQAEGGSQQHIHMTEGREPTESIYGVAVVAAVGAALTVAVFGFAFGWYTLSKKAKAAADVDYPAYGVTGPTVDTTGDRKLAHSAHMYHYQHQKQQILAMERNGVEQREGSLSDPESEEENEEGDYTVYECPGFATTGDMEVKNPMFSEGPTPATPGKVELVKPQQKE